MDLVLSFSESDGWKLPATLAERHLCVDLVLNELRVSDSTPAAPPHSSLSQTHTHTHTHTQSVTHQLHQLSGQAIKLFQVSYTMPLQATFHS